MKKYNEFHGEIKISEIGKALRNIVKKEKTAFKITTGYGSSVGESKSKVAALKSLAKMQKEGLINGYFPGEIKNELLRETSLFYESKIKYGESVKGDSDYGNEGIIFIFIEKSSS